jgi:hypothetical protein
MLAVMTCTAQQCTSHVRYFASRDSSALLFTHEPLPTMMAMSRAVSYQLLYTRGIATAPHKVSRAASTASTAAA